MQNQLTLRDAEQFLQRLYTFAILDKEGKYIYVSDRWLEQYNSTSGLAPVSADDILGRNVTELIPDTKARYVLEKGTPLISEYVEPFHVFSSYLPRYDKDGSINGCYIYTVFQDSLLAELSSRFDRLQKELSFYKAEYEQQTSAKYNINMIIGKSDAVLQLKRDILLAAQSRSTVLIDGETGTGKELVANAIHNASPRSTHPFIRVNCAAIPEQLLESEFFGYAPGSFTGASKKGKQGKFQLADKGSLFLDEINLLSGTMQPKFLRALQEQEIDPVGSEKSIPVDVRLIAASNIPLESLVEQGVFRQDLFFRLNVIRITIPPLRDRKEDIPLLVDDLIQRINHRLGSQIRGAEKSVLRDLEKYDWPGNIRELQNVLEQAANRCNSSVLQEKHLGSFLNRLHMPPALAANQQLTKATAQTELTMIQQALEKNMGNKQKAAQMLGISRASLYRRIEKYHLS